MYDEANSQRGKKSKNLKNLGPGIWHALSAHPAYVDLKPQRLIIPQNLLYDDLQFFVEVLNTRIDEEQSKDIKDSPETLIGPGFSHLKDSNLIHRVRKSRKFRVNLLNR